MQKFKTHLLILLTIINLVLSSASVILPVTGESNSLSSFKQISEFSTLAKNSNSSHLTKVTFGDQVSLAVVQQPDGNAAYVSTEKGKVTQFSMAAQYGSIGLVAHNTLAGKYFNGLSDGDKITLIYGDGTRVNYKVTDIYRYQAVSPTSPYSDFVDPENDKNTLSVETVFNSIYSENGRLVLQTCISKGKVESWGRLFVVAEPTY